MPRQKALKICIAGFTGLLLFFCLLTERNNRMVAPETGMEGKNTYNGSRFNTEVKLLRSIGQHVLSFSR